MKLAIIPARGGSKRIPKKNIRDFAGKPMIAHAIETAFASGCFDDVLVSTDCDEIAQIAKQYGAKVPFKRPNELADDFATTLDVMAHAALWCQSNYHDVSHLCCIYATSPLLKPDFLQQAQQLLEQHQSDYVFAACEYDFAIQRGFTLSNSGQVAMMYPEHMLTRSQDLTPAYHDAGQFYFAPIASFLEKRPIFSAASTPLVLPRRYCQDIDTEEDWQFARLLFDHLS